MGVVNFPVQERLNRVALETNLRRIERTIPFLKKHLKETSELPTKHHVDQTMASIAALREALDYISYHLTKVPQL